MDKKEHVCMLHRLIMGSAIADLGGPVFTCHVLRRGSLPFEVVRDVMRALLACDEDFERLQWGPESKQVGQHQCQELDESVSIKGMVSTTATVMRRGDAEYEEN